MVRLRTSIRSRWHLSHLFSRLMSRGFDRWAGSGDASKYLVAIPCVAVMMAVVAVMVAVSVAGVAVAIRCVAVTGVHRLLGRCGTC